MNPRLVRLVLCSVLSLIGLASVASPALASQSSLRNPILPLDAAGNDSPDPWIFKHNGKYWINYTANGKLVYRSARLLGELSNAPERQIWPPAGQNEPADRSDELWAPETHRINGKWYVYYTANGGSVDFGIHRMYVLESKTGSPAGPYVYKGELEVPQPFAIDASVIELNGRIFMSYSGGPSVMPASLYMVELANPWTLKGEPIMISTPDHDWEKSVLPINEGPEFLIRGNRLHVIFSASWCGSGLYALGRLTVPKTADLTDPATWTDAKYPNPVFETDASRGVYGPGHGSFFTTGGGKEFWNVYHATEEAGKGCFTGGLRTTRIQRFTWRKDGTPNFGRPVSLSTDIRPPRGEKTIAIQAESSGFTNPARATHVDERRFYGYAGRTLNPAGGKLPAMKFRLRKKARYRVFLRILAGPETRKVSLIRPDGRRVTRQTKRARVKPVELNMGVMRLAGGKRFLRLRSPAPVALDQIRLQPRG